MKKSISIFTILLTALISVPCFTSDSFAAKDNDKKTQCEEVRKGKFTPPNTCWCDGTIMAEGAMTCDEIKAQKKEIKATKKAEKDANKAKKKSDKEATDKAKKEAEAKDKAKCENTIHGEYRLNACWCGATKVTDQSKTCEQIKTEKDANKAKKKSDKETTDKAKKEAEAQDKAKCENTIHGEYRLNACWCGVTKVTDQSKTCEQIKTEKDQKKTELKDKTKRGLGKTKEGLKAGWDKTGGKIKEKIDNKKRAKQEKKAANELERQFNNDMDMLEDALNKTISVIKKACATQSGIIDAQTLKCRVVASAGE